MSSASDRTSRVAWDGASYHAAAGPHASWGKELAGSYPWRGDEVVLDAGCGTGRFTAKLLELIPDGRILAVDVDETMLAVANNELAGAIEEGRATLHGADLLDFTPPEKVDVVFSSAVFHWIADQGGLWRRCFSWLRGGGWLWAQCGGRGNLESEKALVSEVATAAPFDLKPADLVRGHHLSGAEETRDLLIEAGFVEVQTSLDPQAATFESPEDFDALVRAVMLRPYRPKFDEAAWEEFVARWSRRQIERHGLRINYVRLNIRARRPE